jgi:hypothetical protein
MSEVKSKISFSQVKLILKKPTAERSQEDVKDLREYFQDNEFFNKFESDKGEKGLQLLLGVIKYETIGPVSQNQR